MIDAADFKQYIFPLLFFKRVSDIWDEEYQEALELADGDMDYANYRENHRFQIPDGCPAGAFFVRLHKCKGRLVLMFSNTVYFTGTRQA